MKLLKTWFWLSGGLLCAALMGAAPAQAAPPKVLRYALSSAETGFDPAQVSDFYSRTVITHIFESPLTYDYLARPVQIKPQTAARLPEASADFRTWRFTLSPGIYFADDPAFKGKRRELVAEDYVYAIKRLYDPKLKSPVLGVVDGWQITGIAALREAAKPGARFDVDVPVAGIRATGRYSFEVKVDEPMPHLDNDFADPAVTGAVAREVVEAYGERIMAHPVGTGPYRLVDWRRSSRIVLEKNPGFREQFYAATPPADDALSQRIAARLRGKRLPLIDRVELYIIEEAQPRTLAFLNGEHDMVDRLPPELSPSIIPNNALAPHLALRGVGMQHTLAADVMFAYFNMQDATVGGYTPAQTALRRAIAMAYDVEAEIMRVRKGQAIPAQGLVPPHVFGYSPTLKTEMSTHSVARAKALLDVYGFVDRNGDGRRERPDGSPLLIRLASMPDQTARAQQEVWRKAFDALGLAHRFDIAKWPEQLKASRSGKLMMWHSAWTATSADPTYMLDLGYGGSIGRANHARFDLPEYNQLHERQRVMADTPERQALIDRMQKLLVAYMPYKIVGHRYLTDLLQPWVHGYRKHPFMREHWRYMDIDQAELARRKTK